VWAHVVAHFRTFLDNLELSPFERVDAEDKARRVARCLWQRYYLGEFSPGSYLIAGSYGKKTACRPPSDLDVLFLLPPQLLDRVERFSGNRQSQLLQQVKLALLDTFPNTELRADGQVVVAPFQSYSVDVAPAFWRGDGTYLICNTAEGGSWKITNPAAERQLIRESDLATGGKATDLIKMLKSWKATCSVEIKSVSLEVLACVFVNRWAYRDKSLFWYDWLVRDFFEFMRFYKNGWTAIVGTEERIELGDNWWTKCETAYDRALKACRYETADLELEAALEWQKIFGVQFPRFRRLAAAMSA